MVPLLMVQAPAESAIAVFATGVSAAFSIAIFSGMTFGALRLIRRALGVGSDV